MIKYLLIKCLALIGLYLPVASMEDSTPFAQFGVSATREYFNYQEFDEQNRYLDG